MQTILIIEDNPTLSRFTARVLGDQLEDMDVEIVTALSCTIARESIRKYRPAVVIVDRFLPDGNGLDLVSEMSKNGTSFQSILVSGEPMYSLPENVYAVFGKPFEIQKLAKVVRAILEKRDNKSTPSKSHIQNTYKKPTKPFQSIEPRPIDTHLIKNRLSGLLAGLRAFGSDIRAEADNPNAVLETTNFYVERLCSTVMDISSLIGRRERN